MMVNSAQLYQSTARSGCLMCVYPDVALTTLAAADLYVAYQSSERVLVLALFFFFQAEDGIRDPLVTEFRRVLFRSTEVGERIPAAWSSLDGGVRGVELEEPAHCRVVAEDRRRMNVGARDLGVRGENGLGALEDPRHMPGVERDAGGFDESGERSGHRS